MAKFNLFQKILSLYKKVFTEEIKSENGSFPRRKNTRSLVFFGQFSRFGYNYSVRVIMQGLLSFYMLWFSPGFRRG